MKLQINKSAFSEAINSALAASPSKATLPALDCALLSTQSGKLSISCTDLDIYIEKSVPAEIETEGAICLPSKRIASVVREMPGETISMEVSNQSAIIASGRTKTKLMGLDPFEFPKREQEDFADTSEIDGKALQAALKQVAFAASFDESRYVLNGVLFDASDSSQRLISTDGRRLCISALDGIPVGVNAIVPNKSVSALIKTLSGEPVSCSFGESFAEFEFAQTSIRTRLIVGSFPNWRQVMPDGLDIDLEIEREPLLAAVKRVGLMASEQSSSIKLAFSENQLTVSASAPEIGEASESLDLRCYFDAVMAVNPAYIQQALQAVSAETVALSMSASGTDPILIKSGNWQSVLMPMRVG